MSWTLVRATALFGFSCIFLTILSTEYMRYLLKLFGKPFLMVHHMLAVTGLVLIAMHPLALALLAHDPRAYTLHISSLRAFLVWGGQPALLLFGVAVLAAVLRKRIKSVWRLMHWLNYLAFILAFVHSWLLGSNVTTSALRYIWQAMTAIVVAVFLYKRFAHRQP
jgi:DMSO/TMAO reductase YedYZ heme-binding membrane subunit